MKRKIVFLLGLGLAVMPGMAQARRRPPAPKPQSRGTETVPTLESVLTQMDKTAAEFKTAEAALEQDQLTKVVNETDVQKGTVYFQRKGNAMDMMVVFKQPQEKYVLYSGNWLQVFQPSIDQVNKYDLSKHKQEVDTFLTLGFGGRGHDLPKSFEVKLVATEMVGGIRTAKLDLIPKNSQARNAANHILLWIDLARGVSVQQQFFEPSGDYRLAKYSDIKLNQNLPSDTFKLKTTGKTKVVTP
jgi:outer membrane lipoprotein-sorting protein